MTLRCFTVSKLTANYGLSVFNNLSKAVYKINPVYTLILNKSIDQQLHFFHNESKSQGEKSNITNPAKNVQEKIAPLQMKKRPIRRKKILDGEEKRTPGVRIFFQM